MLLHLGGDWAANSRRIIAILDYGSVAGSRSVKKMLAEAGARNLLETIDDEGQTRSLILLESGGSTRLVLSPISSSALKGRLAAGGLTLELGGRTLRKGRSNG